MSDDAEYKVTHPAVVRHLGLKVTLLAIASAVIFAGFVLYVAYARGAFRPVQTLTLRADSAEGIGVGMDLSYRGFPVGRVRRISLGADAKAHVVVAVPVEDARWLRANSVFIMERSIVGVSKLRAFTSDLGAAALEDGAVRDLIRGDATEEIPQILANVRHIIENLEAMTGQASALNHSLSSLSTVTGRMAGKAGLLEAALGSQENAQKVIASIERTNALLADLRRVHDVDTTGAEMLIRIDERVRARGRRLLVAQAAPGDPQWDFLVDTGVIASLGERAFLPDTDRALEFAENEVIDALHGERSVRAEIPLVQLQPFALLDSAELAVLAPHLQRRTFAPAEFVFREGDPGDEMFVIAMGTASVRRTEGARSHRLVTFSEGTVFGEMALLDAQPRSASVQADGPLVCYVLGRADFERLVADQHRIALKLLTSLSQELGRRLRFANETINHLQN